MTNIVQSFLCTTAPRVVWVSAVALCITGHALTCGASTAAASLHESTVCEFITELASPQEAQRSAAAANLGLLRAYGAAEVLVEATRDISVDVRRNACLSLAWCGGRKQVPALLLKLDDPDWSVRQAAWVALTNLTGMEFPYEAHAEPALRDRQAKRWRGWWATVPERAPPPELFDLLGRPRLDLAANRAVTASSTYKGPVSVLTAASRNAFWQTKNISFPQHCTVDLGSAKTVGCIAISQYGVGFCMTDYAIAVSDDGKAYRTLCREKGRTRPALLVSFPQVKARYIRIISHASENPIYPTTFYRISVFEEESDGEGLVSSDLKRERAMRALGCLGGKKACASIRAILETYVSRGARDTEEKLMVQAGIRALGRLPDAEAQALLFRLLGNAQWARYAADALGDVGGEAAAEALISAYPAYAMSIDRKPPSKGPKDDMAGFASAGTDRMYETPYAIALALSRFPLQSEELRRKLRTIAPLLVANMAGDFDGAMIYEEHAFQDVTGYLLDRAGMRRDVCEIAFEALGHPSPAPHDSVVPPPTRARLLALAKQSPGGTSFAATWLTALCRDKDHVPRLIQLLNHNNGWVRINAAKSLMFMDAKSAIRPIAAMLKESKTEAEHGYFGGFLFKHAKQGQAEYNAPSPNWREAYTRALGRLGTSEHVPLLIKLLNDDRNVLEIQYSAALSLDQIGTAGAMTALRKTTTTHPFHSIRLVAREALWKRSLEWPPAVQDVQPASPKDNGVSAPNPGKPTALVFIKGSNNMPNDFQIDIWRQTYSTTDSGPTYRLGENLYLLTPATSNGVATPLTSFTNGYVADCEVSWDATRVVFARREQENPWWHIYELDLRGGQPRQLTSGPYHDVQPVYLPDGRIAFSSSRTGMRDEYHGYPATGLSVMNGDGSDIHCIGFNLGRDNEPAVLPDGQIVFSRLELFYSRLKTEITVHTVRPDGTMNQTFYGPEKRTLWKNITRQSGERGWGEAPPRHRVLRLTQAQPLGKQQVIVATTGGATIVGPSRLHERIIPRYKNMTVTSPFPLDEDNVLCASTVRTQNRKAVDLGLYTMDVNSGRLTLLYNDPTRADFEARPVMKRALPHALPETPIPNSFTTRLLCNSARTSQEELTRTRGKLVRIIEGRPITGRHHTHTSSSGQAWKNHVGTHARILGTVPLAADGSFFVEIPADRLIHCQVLDSDRRVVGNQLIWMYARPGETRTCVGCHEMPDTAAYTERSAFPYSGTSPPIRCLPTGHEFSYRAKAWQKGNLFVETEERTRTVNAVSFPGRL